MFLICVESEGFSRWNGFRERAVRVAGFLIVAIWMSVNSLGNIRAVRALSIGSQTCFCRTLNLGRGSLYIYFDI